MIETVSDIVIIICVLVLGLCLLFARSHRRVLVDQNRQTEKELIQSQANLHAIIDNTDMAIYIVDIAGNFILANKKFESLYHVNASDVVGKNVYDALPKKYADQIFESHFKVVQSRMPISVEEMISMESGSKIYLSKKFPIYDVRGAPNAICNISTEIAIERELRPSVSSDSSEAVKIADSEPVEKSLPSKADSMIKAMVKSAKDEAVLLTTRKMSLIDMERIHAIFGEDQAQVQAFLKLFISSAAELLKAMKVAIAKKDVELSSSLLLRLKGAAENSGAMHIHSLCVVAEENIKKSDWASVEKGYRSIVNSFKRMKNEAAEKFNLS